MTTFTAAFTGARTTESMEVLGKLCALKGSVVDNLLHCIAGMSDSEQTITVLSVDGAGAGAPDGQSNKVFFESQRRMAKAELEKRCRPGYDPKHYVEGRATSSR